MKTACRGSLAGRRVYGRRCRGQSLLETCLAILVVCLVFAGLTQVAHVLAAREILNHAANRACRARAVGFNNWMIRKSVRVAAIPNAGRMVVPFFENLDPWLEGAVATLRPGDLWTAVLGTVPVSEQADLEKARIPQFLAGPTAWQAYNLLDYADWDTVHENLPAVVVDPAAADSIVHGTVNQEYPLKFPMHRAFYDADSVPLEGDAKIESHYRLYLDAQAEYL